MNNPNIVISGLSEAFTLDGEIYQAEIYRLEGGNEWTLEVIDSENTSTVWDDVFESDLAAYNELQRTIREEGKEAFKEKNNVIPFPQ